MGIACIVPHAGWRFSGRMAASAIAALQPADVIVLIGGHLAQEEGVQLLPYQRYETPAGTIEADRELPGYLCWRFRMRKNAGIDNTTEVQLPLLAALRPGVPLCVLRAPPSDEAGRLGDVLAQYADESGRRLAVVGSTDLTHYGPAYGFSPQGSAAEAHDWVTSVNDQAFIDAALALEWREMNRVGLEERAACSAGAAAAAAAYAKGAGCTGGELLEHSDSFSLMPGDSIVGYAAILFPRQEAR